MKAILVVATLVAILGCADGFMYGHVAERYYLTTDSTAYVYFVGEQTIVGDERGEWETETSFRVSGDTAVCYDVRFSSLFIFVRK